MLDGGVKHQDNHSVQLHSLQQHPAERRQEEEVQQPGDDRTSYLKEKTERSTKLQGHRDQHSHTHLVVSAGDAAEEDEVGDEEARAQVEVDAVTCSLYGAAEAEGQDAQKQTDQRQN